MKTIKTQFSAVKKHLLLINLFIYLFVITAKGTDKLIFDLNNAMKADDGTIFIPLKYESNDSVLGIDFIMDYDETRLTFVDIDFATINSTYMGENSSDIDYVARFTAYSKIYQGFSTTEALFYIKFTSIDGYIYPQDIDDITPYFNGNLCQFEILGTVSANLPVGVKEIKEEELIMPNLYPNPNSGVFNLEVVNNEYKSLEVNILDITGKIIYAESIDNNTKVLKKQIDLSSYAKGIYVMQVQSDKEAFTKKIVIE